MLLSILICTIETRKDKFTRLYNFLSKQAEKFEDIEILFHCDNKEISVGAKRQLLLEKAKGKFICFIDDDDWISDFYIKEIRKSIIENPDIDCIGFKIQCAGQLTGIANVSNKYPEWRDNQDGYRYVRTIYHKSPVKREHALKVGFEDSRFGEDHVYSMGLKKAGLLKKEHHIDKIMYIYQYFYEHHATKYGIK